MNPFSFLTLLVGVIFLLMSYITRKSPPKKINKIYGYRTKRSMMSQENWDEGNRYSTQLMMRSGYILILSAMLGHFYSSRPFLTWYLALILILIIVALIFVLTERHLKKKFE